MVCKTQANPFGKQMTGGWPARTETAPVRPEIVYLMDRDDPVSFPKGIYSVQAYLEHASLEEEHLVVS